MGFTQKQLIVAVIDTGYSNIKPYPNINLCKTGHSDYVDKTVPIDTVPKDYHGHGTNVASIIDGYLNDLDHNSYCLVILKYYSENIPASQTVINTISAFQKANAIGADYINYSGGGEVGDGDEGMAVKSNLDRGAIVVVSAMNHGKYLSKIPVEGEDTVAVYPALYDDRLIVVGNLNPDDSIHKRSNYGPNVKVWEKGTDISAGGITLSGTSQATAVHTGKIIRERILKGETR